MATCRLVGQNGLDKQCHRTIRFQYSQRFGTLNGNALEVALQPLVTKPLGLSSRVFSPFHRRVEAGFAPGKSGLKFLGKHSLRSRKTGKKPKFLHNANLGSRACCSSSEPHFARGSQFQDVLGAKLPPSGSAFGLTSLYASSQKP